MSEEKAAAVPSLNPAAHKERKGTGPWRGTVRSSTCLGHSFIEVRLTFAFY